MKFTQEQLKQIIKEELEAVIDEGWISDKFDKAKKAFGFDGKKDYFALRTEFMKSPVYREKLQEAGIDTTRRLDFGGKMITVHEFFSMALRSIGEAFDVVLVNTVEDVANPPNFREGEAAEMLTGQLQYNLRSYLHRDGRNYEDGEVIPSEKIKIVLDAAIEFFHEKWASGEAKFTATGGGSKTGLAGAAMGLPGLGI